MSSISGNDMDRDACLVSELLASVETFSTNTFTVLVDRVHTHCKILTKRG